jgi:hypothetical protein
VHLFEELWEEFTDNVLYLGFVGRIAARLGDRERALGVGDQLASLDVPYLRGRNTCERAKITAILGDDDGAVSLLRHAIGEGRDYDGHWLHRDIDFESLRDYPPFQELMRPKG